MRWVYVLTQTRSILFGECNHLQTSLNSTNSWAWLISSASFLHSCQRRPSPCETYWVQRTNGSGGEASNKPLTTWRLTWAQSHLDTIWCWSRHMCQCRCLIIWVGGSSNSETTFRRLETSFLHLNSTHSHRAMVCTNWKGGFGSNLGIKTDHKPLVPLLTSKNLDELPIRVQRFRLRLMRFSFSMSHVPGKELV